MTNPRRYLRFILILTAVTSAAAGNCGLTNVNHKISNDTADTVTLSWQLSPDCSSSSDHKFEVTAVHRKFFACHDETDSSRTLDTTENSITLNRLHPFSLYRCQCS
jgi:hypothetical protein